MKTFTTFIVFVLFSFVSIAQTASPCDSFISVKEDRVTGKTTVSGKEKIILSGNETKGEIGLLTLKVEKSIILAAIMTGVACVDEGDKANILFRDGSRMELKNDGDFNCQGRFKVYFGGVFGRKKEIEILKEKEIETLRIWARGEYIQKDFTPEQSKQLMGAIKCLSDN